MDNFFLLLRRRTTEWPVPLSIRDLCVPSLLWMCPPRGPASADWACTGRLQKMVRSTLVLPATIGAGIMQAVACMLAAPFLFTMLGKQGGKHRASEKIKQITMSRSTLQGKGRGSTAVGLGEKIIKKTKCPNNFGKEVIATPLGLPGKLINNTGCSRNCGLAGTRKS